MKATHYLRNYLYPQIIDVYSKTENEIYTLRNNKWEKIEGDTFISTAVVNNLHKSLRRIERITGTYFFSSLPLKDSYPKGNFIPEIFLQSNCLEFKDTNTLKVSTLKTLVCGNIKEHYIGEQVLLYCEDQNKALTENVIVNSFGLKIRGHALYMPAKLYNKIQIFNKVA